MMTTRRPICACLAAVLSFAAATSSRSGFAVQQVPPSKQPIALHPKNPHYFLFRGKPTVLITSAEHYGAVLNLDFDFEPYFKELQSHGLNLTRAFSGAYVEGPQSFNIAKNTLAPLKGRFICPWARSDQPGYANGGNKFDLARWDDAYFNRLKSFVAEAGRHGVVVEFVFFCPFYDEHQWELSPMNARNNVNGVGRLKREEAYALKDAELQAVQEAMVRKVVAELKDFDNLYYEICNEPYFGGVTIPWQRRIAEVIVDAEKDFPHKHLIAQNVQNDKAKVIVDASKEAPDGKGKVERAHPAVSVFNFHYATPPDAVALNYDLNKVIGDDETGFRGTADLPYRAEAWDFILAGGGVYNNLDYSFTADNEDGSFHPLPPKQPGGGGESLRRQLSVLKDFINGFDFIAMRPDKAVIKGGVPSGATARALVEPGKAYAVYVRGGKELALSLDLPAGRYRAEWVNTKTGRVDKSQDVDHGGGEVKLASPGYDEDIALRVASK